MKKIIGFAENSEPKEETVALPANSEEEKPIKSLVKVFFPERNREYAYYNDSFNLKCNDRVYVSGKLYGKLGIVTDVTTFFRINTADYKKVIAKPDPSIRGTFIQIKDKMVSSDTDMTSEKFAALVIPPPDPDEEPRDGEIIYGDGWSVELEDFESSPDVDSYTLCNAVSRCENGDVKYISIHNGKGIAYIGKQNLHTVEFDFDGKTVSNLYCDCLYPDFCICAHEAAMLITLRMLCDSENLENRESFVAIDKKYFMQHMLNTSCRISLD